ncbi:MAG: phosphate ABC transporter substrate-binding protein [Nitrososphaerota archaeon]|nr:phosphate ABC transporter substrate-binding protein [Nitrososphaerota archaeon]
MKSGNGSRVSSKAFVLSLVVVALVMFAAGYIASGLIAPTGRLSVTTVTEVKTVPGAGSATTITEVKTFATTLTEMKTVTATKLVTTTKQETVTAVGPSGLDLNLDVSGSTTVAPIAEEAARKFMELYPGFKISVSGVGTGPGIKAVGDGEADIGMASRDIEKKEFDQWPDLKPFKIALDSVAIVVHPNNPVKDLTIEQVAKIFAGEITNWKEVGGPDREIHVITREKGSGTRDAFEHIVMKPYKKEITGKASVQEGNPRVRAAIAADPAAIGYLSLGFVDPTVKAVNINGVEPTVDNVLKGAYPVIRNLYLVTKGPPSPSELLFIGFVLSEEGQRIVAELGYIPLYKVEMKK